MPKWFPFRQLSGSSMLSWFFEPLWAVFKARSLPFTESRAGGFGCHVPSVPLESRP